MALYESALTPIVSTTISSDVCIIYQHLEELNPEFAEARVFSKVDANAGYWSIHLDEACQEITTFRTPFGRYCYRRLPSGLCLSQDLFQQAMDRILARAPGCVGIADDVVMYGRDNAEHDKNPLRLMQVAKEEGLVFKFREIRHQDQRNRFLRVCVWQGWHQARPVQDRRHVQYAYPTRQGRSATVHRFDELFGGIYTAFRKQGVTVAITPQEGHRIRVARRSRAYL